MTSLGREQLNEYLEKPLELEANQLSTSVNFSATSLSSGGIEGVLLIKRDGKIVVNDGSNDRIVLGNLRFK